MQAVATECLARRGAAEGAWQAEGAVAAVQVGLAKFAAEGWGPRKTLQWHHAA